MSWREVFISLVSVVITAIAFLIKGFVTNWVNDTWNARKTRKLKPFQLIRNEIILSHTLKNLKWCNKYYCCDIMFQLKNESHKDVVIRSGRLGEYSLTSLRQATVEYQDRDNTFEGFLVPAYTKKYIYCLCELEYDKYNEIPDNTQLELYYDIEEFHCGPQTLSARINKCNHCCPAPLSPG